MKKYLLSLLSFFFFSVALAQKTNLVADTGNVGIGTTIPVVKLSVFSPIENGAAISMQSGTNSRFYIQQGGTLLKIGGITNGADGVINIKSTGNVGIGTAEPGTHKLSVEGTIAARKVKVTSLSNWADYVFHPDYKLPPLKEVEKFIKRYSHLPEIPSEKEVMENGLDLSEINKKLLQKVEELTLYLIELEKENNSIKDQNKGILDRLEKLERK